MDDEQLRAELAKLKRYCETVIGQWDGDGPYGEDKVRCAEDITKVSMDLEELLDQMELLV